LSILEFTSCNRKPQFTNNNNSKAISFNAYLKISKYKERGINILNNPEGNKAGSLQQLNKLKIETYFVATLKQVTKLFKFKLFV
jgi:hypothetical protein